MCLCSCDDCSHHPNSNGRRGIYRSRYAHEVHLLHSRYRSFPYPLSTSHHRDRRLNGRVAGVSVPFDHSTVLEDDTLNDPDGDANMNEAIDAGIEMAPNLDEDVIMSGMDATPAEEMAGILEDIGAEDNAVAGLDGWNLPEGDAVTEQNYSGAVKCPREYDNSTFLSGKIFHQVSDCRYV